MFVLTTSECEILSSSTKVELFATHEEAHAAMVDAAHKSAFDAGIEPDEFSDYIDCIDDDGGYIVEVIGWQIRELPGVFIPEAAAQGFKKSISEAAEMYGDESREDWFDADDICKDVCWELEDYLGGE